MLRTNLTTEDIDDVLAGTFPASDPPAWTPGITRPAPALARPAAAAATASAAGHSVRASAVIDVSRPAHSERTFAQGLVSLIGAAGLAVLIPLAVVAVGTPVALVLRRVVAAAGGLLAIVR
jgi:hypothetical protein